jgi:hypothetical protein
MTSYLFLHRKIIMTYVYPAIEEFSDQYQYDSVSVLRNGKFFIHKIISTFMSLRGDAND